MQFSFVSKSYAEYLYVPSYHLDIPADLTWCEGYPQNMCSTVPHIIDGRNPHKVPWGAMPHSKPHPTTIYCKNTSYLPRPAFYSTFTLRKRAGRFLVCVSSKIGSTLCSSSWLLVAILPEKRTRSSKIPLGMDHQQGGRGTSKN